MSEYLTYTLWRQREERMPHELERQRVVEERLREQDLERDLGRQLSESPEREAALEPAQAIGGDEYVLVNE